MPEKDYSHRDVTDKLGLKPSGIKEFAARVEAKIERKLASAKTPADVILYWPLAAEEIVPTLAELKEAVVPNGGIWVITAKKNCTSASGMNYFMQDALIPMGKAAGLVDNKICSLNECESAMRFVIRRADRKK